MKKFFAMLTASAVAAAILAAPAAAYDRKEVGIAGFWAGKCVRFTINGNLVPLCSNKMRLWLSKDQSRYNFATLSKQSEDGDITTYELIGSHSFIAPIGEVDTFLIDEVWITKPVRGKDKTIKSRASGKCITLLDGGTIYLDCTVKTAAGVSIQWKFSGQGIPQEDRGGAAVDERCGHDAQRPGHPQHRARVGGRLCPRLRAGPPARRANHMGMKMTTNLIRMTMMAAAVVAASAAHAQQQSSRAFYDSRGHFSGSAITRGNSTALRDRTGHFSGSAVRNSDGTTSLYDSRGHFVGSTREQRQ